MPNHIRNIVIIREDDRTELKDIKAVEKAVRGKEDGKIVRFDFDKIIPMPADVFRGNLGAEDEKKYPGEKNWYGWCIKNWGTKWGAYDIKYDGFGTWIFSTAWAHPFPVIKALSRMFPKIEFEVLFADEDIGSNLGAYTIKNGRKTKDMKPDDRTARYFALAMNQ